MDFEDMNSLQIEDLGRFLSEHMPEPGGEEWKGFSLGYAEEETNGPSSTVANQPQASYNNLMSSSLPNSPFPSAFLSRQALDSAMSEFNDFSLEDKVKETAKMVDRQQITISTIAQPTSELPPQSVPVWNAPPLQRKNSPQSNALNIKRSFGAMQACDGASCSTIVPAGVEDEDDRGYRKKSREKMRRQEVNVKFDELTHLLGMNDKVRKSAVLQEAINSIKSLQRERDELRLDRDRMKQEVSKLASCLQFSHMGSMVAANAMAMTQMPINHVPGPTQSHHFPVNPGYGMNYPPYIPPTASMGPTSVCPPIAPKLDSKPLAKSM